METRKIIKFGNSSHIVSIPKSWMKENKLKKGDLVYLKKNSNGELIILPKEKDDAVFKKAVIHATPKDMKLIWREILAAYIKGFNILSIESKDIKEKTPEIKNILKHLIGIDILEKNSKEIIAADFLDIKSISLNSVIRRMDNNVRSMFDDLDICIKNKKVVEKEFKEIYETDEDVNRFYFLLWKLTVQGLSSPSVQHKLDMDPVKLTHTWWLGMNVERIGDDIKRIARELKNIKNKNNGMNKIYNIFMKVKYNYADALKAYYKKDLALAYNVTSAKRDVMKESNTLSTTTNNLKIAKVCEKLKSAQNSIHNIAKCTIYFT